ncbi:hypothetical protein BJX65DRAFT_283598 [Aspergillus insuetus]
MPGDLFLYLVALSSFHMMFLLGNAHTSCAQRRNTPEQLSQVSTVLRPAKPIYVLLYMLLAEL